jgi:uncharacterized protein YbjT (DUF2867 family)
MSTDTLGRPAIGADLRTEIDRALAALDPAKRGAVVVLADDHGVRGHLAARIGTAWKVAGGAGIAWTEPRPYGWVGVEYAW